MELDQFRSAILNPPFWIVNCRIIKERFRLGAFWRVFVENQFLREPPIEKRGNYSSKTYYVIYMYVLIVELFS